VQVTPGAADKILVDADDPMTEDNNQGPTDAQRLDALEAKARAPRLPKQAVMHRLQRRSRARCPGLTRRSRLPRPPGTAHHMQACPACVALLDILHAPARRVAHERAARSRSGGVRAAACADGARRQAGRGRWRRMTRGRDGR